MKGPFWRLEYLHKDGAISFAGTYAKNWADAKEKGENARLKPKDGKTGFLKVRENGC